VYPPSPENGARFAASRKAEINGLLEANVFGVMRRSDAIADGCRLFKSRFVDAVKNPDTAKAIDKSRFVICGYQDKDAKELKANAEPGHSFSEISSRGPGWVTSKDESAQSKCKPGASGQCQDLGRLADHASVGSVGQLIKIAMLRVKNALPFLEC
jgi:hypothetical protein